MQSKGRVLRRHQTGVVVPALHVRQSAQVAFRNLYTGARRAASCGSVEPMMRSCEWEQRCCAGNGRWGWIVHATGDPGVDYLYLYR
jgi:hypothetical protein